MIIVSHGLLLRQECIHGFAAVWIIDSLGNTGDVILYIMCKLKHQIFVVGQNVLIKMAAGIDISDQHGNR